MHVLLYLLCEKKEEPPPRLYRFYNFSGNQNFRPVHTSASEVIIPFFIIDTVNPPSYYIQ